MRLALLFVLGSTCLFGGCRKEPPGEHRPAPSASAAPAESYAAKAVASVIASVRRDKLSVAAPSWEKQPMSFGRGLFVRFSETGVEAYRVPELELVSAQPLEEPRAVVQIAGGSIVAAGVLETLRFDAGAKRAVRLSPITLGPGALLLPERRDSSALWVAHRPGGLLSKHSLTLSGERSVAAVATPDGYQGGPITVLRDGALLYAAEDGIRRALPEGNARSFDSDFSPWRLLPGRRVDQAYAIDREGAVELWQIGDRLRTVRGFSLGAPPFDAAASAEFLAAILVEEGGARPRRFLLRVFTEAGERVLERELPQLPVPAGESWIEAIARQRSLALSEDAPLVAVGGRGSLRVFRLPKGELVLEK